MLLRRNHDLRSSPYCCLPVPTMFRYPTPTICLTLLSLPTHSFNYTFIPRIFTAVFAFVSV